MFISSPVLVPLFKQLPLPRIFCLSCLAPPQHFPLLLKQQLPGSLPSTLPGWACRCWGPMSSDNGMCTCPQAHRACIIPGIQVIQQLMSTYRFISQKAQILINLCIPILAQYLAYSVQRANTVMHHVPMRTHSGKCVVGDFSIVQTSQSACSLVLLGYKHVTVQHEVESSTRKMMHSRDVINTTWMRHTVLQQAFFFFYK